MGNIGVYVRVRTTDVRAISLENRQGFTAFESSNLTLSAKLDRTALDPKELTLSIRSAVG